ncbi:MAG: C2H2-type zinc finger protein [Nitrosotalea sp.]
MLGFSKSKVRIKMRLFKKHKCEKCGRRFGQQEELMHHEQIAHDVSMYDCKECNLYFPSMEAMRTHLQRMHSYQGKKDSQ